MTVLATSRDPSARLPHLPASNRICFDLAMEDTWANIPPCARIIWCFPAMPLDLVQRFAQRYIGSGTKLLVLGSTSAYDLPAEQNTFPPPWLDETAPINRSLPRVQGEGYLREHYGAIVLRVAGIYGPGRNPLDWIRAGRVAPSGKYVNLIHVEDLAEICLLGLDRGIPGDTYNVSDGRPKQWSEIWEEASRRWGVPPPPTTDMSTRGKRISTEALRRRIEPAFQHPDLYAALEQLEARHT